jgi:hypothetical protein
VTQNPNSVSDEFLKDLDQIRTELGEEREQPDALQKGPLGEVESYLDSIHFRMAGMATICQQVFDPKDIRLAEDLSSLFIFLVLPFGLFPPAYEKSLHPK